jgi:hypothetical protein
MVSKPISIINCNWLEINLNADSKFMRVAVFLKFFVWDLVIRRCEITTKECWVIAGINTVMPRIPPR